MHVRTGPWRHLVAAIAIVTFALPLTSLTTSAQTSSGNPSQTTFASNVANVGAVTAANPSAYDPSISIDPEGDSEIFTLTCNAPSNPAVASYGPTNGLGDPNAGGCYNVTISAQNATVGGQVPLQTTTCMGIANTPNGSLFPDTADGNYQIGQESGGAGYCDYLYPTGTAAGPEPFDGNQATATIAEDNNDTYIVQFSGYVPAICPAGTVFAGAGYSDQADSTTNACINTTSGTPAAAICPAGTSTSPTWLPDGSFNGFATGAAGAYCAFTLTGQKKYVEVNKVTLTEQTGGCGFDLTYAEGLKAYFGPSCTFTAVATGETVIKPNGEDCTQAPAPSAAAAEFGTGAIYVCNNGALYVTNIPVPGASITFTTTAGGFSSGNTLTTGSGTLCTAAANSGSTSVTADSTGTATATLCPNGAIAGSVKACTSPSTNNQQPGGICSASLQFAYTLYASRVVPQVRWAGEKIALTKCFGDGMAYDDVEFTLQSTGDPLDATLLPASEYGLGTGGGVFNSYGGTGATNASVWVAADSNGCATVLGYAAGEGVMDVDAAVYASGSGQGVGTGGTVATSGDCVGQPYEDTISGCSAAAPLINEHAFEVFYLKFERVDLENLTPATYSTKTAFSPYYTSFLAGTPAFGGATLGPTSFPSNAFGGFPNAPGTGDVAGATGYQVPLCQTQYIRAMVHGYFEMPGDPSGRPAATVAIPNAPAGSAGSYVLPAGRWVLPEDWPLLATFAGVSPAGTGTDATPSSYYAWDLNSGYVFNPAGEAPIICEGVGVSTADGSFAPPTVVSGNGPISNYDTGPCYGSWDGSFATGETYTSAPNGTNCSGQTIGIGPFDPTQSCLDTYSPTSPTAGLTTTSGVGGTSLVATGPNSTFLPNGTLNEWDAPMPPAQISFSIGSGPGYLSEVNKTGLYSLVFDTGGSTCPTGYHLNATTGTCQIVVNPDPFYAEAIPASPLIPPVMNDGGYLWDSWNFGQGAYGSSSLTTTGAGFIPGVSTTVTLASDMCPVGFSGTGGSCTSTTISQQICSNVDGYSYDTTTGTCSGLPIPANNTTDNLSYYGGMVLTPFCFTDQSGTNGSGGGIATFTIADGTGFYVGEPLVGFSDGDGEGWGNYVYIDKIQAANVPGLPNAVTLTVTDPYSGDDNGNEAPTVGSCYTTESSLGSGLTVAGLDFGFPVGSAAAQQVGNNAVVTITDPVTGITRTEPVTHVDVTNGIVYVASSYDIARALTDDNCYNAYGDYAGPSTGPGFDGTPNTACLPAAIAPAGTTLVYTNNGANAVINSSVPNPYPFWQWLAGQNNANPSAATVYSDNHGEAVVALQTSVTSSVLAPSSAGTCASGYTPVYENNSISACLAGTSVYGGAGFQNLTSTTLSSISGTGGGCLATFPSGTTSVVSSGTTSIIPANGPSAGQICINGLGGIEFGAGAVLGTTSLQAIADYPYTRGEHPAVASPTLTKVWTSQFVKSLSVGPATSENNGTMSAYTVTITARDLCGNPITGEPIEVYALSGSGSGAVLTPLSTGINLSLGGNTAIVTPGPNGVATLSLEVLNAAIGNGGLVVKAVWPYEQVERFATVISGTSGQTATVTYPPGWQQVGGPAGSNFSVAEALFDWNSATSTYTDVTSSDGSISSNAPACTGYWAYFAAAMSISLTVTSKSGDTAVCQLQAGWNLVGNPFGTPALIPSGTTAYHWNGTAYATTDQIPVGGSDWVYMTSAGTLTLTAS